MKEEITVPVPYVITCGDEGVQINFGTRLSFAGSGFQLEGFSKAVSILKKSLKTDIAIASSQENDWFKQQLGLQEWKEINALAQKHVKTLADKEGLLYSGYLPFSDPKKLKHEVKGHMVRPHDVHVANKICFTLAGGEQTYNLGCYQISADWLYKVPKKLAEEMMLTQVKFYNKVAGMKLILVVEEEGPLGEKIAKKNRKILEKMGLKIVDLKPKS